MPPVPEAGAEAIEARAEAIDARAEAFKAHSLQASAHSLRLQRKAQHQGRVLLAGGWPPVPFAVEEESVHH